MESSKAFAQVVILNMKKLSFNFGQRKESYIDTARSESLLKAVYHLVGSSQFDLGSMMSNSILSEPRESRISEQRVVLSQSFESCLM